MTVDSLHKLLVEHLKDTYDAEKQIVKALPKMVKAASSAELKAALTAHLAVTKTQVTRLEEAFSLLEEKAKGKSCAAMKGLLQEGHEVMEEDAEDPFGDAAMIAAGQKVEHYEIAAYGTACAYAELLGNEQVAELMRQTLAEEKEADEKLTEVAHGLLSQVGSMDEDNEEEEEEPVKPVKARAAKSN